MQTLTWHWQLVCDAKEKPTGNAERTKDDPRQVALEIEDKIAEKCGTLSLNNPEYSENNLEPQKSSDESRNESDDSDVVIITHEKENSKEKKVRGGVIMVEAYYVEPPLANPRKPCYLAAGQALDKTTSTFDPAAIHQCDDHWLSQSVQLSQLSAAPPKIHKLCACNAVIYPPPPILVRLHGIRFVRTGIWFVLSDSGYSDWIPVCPTRLRLFQMVNVL